MKELDPDKVAKFEERRRAIAEQEPVRAKAIKVFNESVQTALRELYDAGSPFFNLLHKAERLHSEAEMDLRVAVEEATVWGRVEEARSLENWLEVWEEIGEGMALSNDGEPAKMKAPNPPISSLLAKLPFRLEDVVTQPAGDRLIDPKVKVSVEASWRRIDGWLSRVAPFLVERMNSGATPEAIAATEKTIGMELPEAVRASYLIHDGSGVMGLFPAGDYLSLKQMRDEYAKWKWLVEEGLGEEEGTPDGPIQKVHCHPGWIPLADYQSGDHILIDLAPAEGGKVGQLINFSHETVPENVAAVGMAEYLAYLADGLEAGAATIGEETYLEWNDEPDTPRSGYVLPSGGPGKVVAASTGGKRYFEFTGGTSSKFWEVFCDGSVLTTRYGKIGSKGQSSVKSFDTHDKASSEAAKLIARKVKEGYVETTP